MLKNMVAMVTGGAGSLGLAAVKKLVDGGWKVVVVDVPGSSKVVNAQLNDKVTLVEGDFTSEEDITKALDIVKSKHGRLDALVNCAGLSKTRVVYNFNKDRSADLTEFLELLRVNVGGTFNASRLAVKLMAKNEPDEDGLRGVVINTSGFYAFDGQIGQAGLSAAGGAISSMTLPLCRDLAPAGIRVMTIAPGIMKSNVIGFIPEKVIKHLELFTPNPKRIGLPEEYASLVMTIIQNKFLNGDTIRLDGGLRLYLM